MGGDDSRAVKNVSYNHLMQSISLIKRKLFSTIDINLLAVVIILLFSLIFFFPYLRFNKTMVPYDLLSHIQPWAPQGSIDFQNGMMGDVLLQIVPWHILYRRALLSGEIPFWNPYSAGGTPFLANHMSQVLYPFNLIFLVLPLDAGITVFGILHKFITGMGMYFLIRRLGFQPISCIVGSLTWMYSGYLTVWLPWLPITATLTWLPWAILLEEMIIVEGKWKYVGWFAAVIALIFLGGHIQFVYYSYLTIVIFAFWRTFTHKSSFKIRIGKLLKITLGAVIGLMAVAIQLVPTLEFSRYITRGPSPIRTLMALAIPTNYLPTLLLPEFLGTANHYLGSGNFVEFTGYIGIFGSALIAAATLFPHWRKRKDLWIFPILGLSSLHLAYGGKINLLLQYLPGYTSFGTPARLYAIWTFAVAIMVAIGMDALLSARGWRYKSVVLLGAGLVGFGCLFILNSWGTMLSIVRVFDIPFGAHMNTLYWAFILIVLAGLTILSLLTVPRLDNRQRAILLSLPLLFISVDLLHFSRDYLPVVAIPSTFPSAPSINYLQNNRDAGRIARFQGGFLGSPLSPNLGIVYGLEDIDAYDSFSKSRYSQLVGAAEPQRYEHVLHYNMLNGFEDPKSLQSPILQVLRVAFLLSERPILALTNYPDSTAQPRWSQVYEDQDMVIYQSQQVLPLVGIYRNYQVVSDYADQLKILSDINFNPTDEVLLSNVPQVEIDSQASGKVKALARTENCLIFQVEIASQTGNSAIVMVAQNNYPGWQAWIDGQKVGIATADGIWQSIVVQAGEHTIQFKFMPSYFFSCTIVSLVSFSLILFLIIFRVNGPLPLSLKLVGGKDEP